MPLGAFEGVCIFVEASEAVEKEPCSEKREVFETYQQLLEILEMYGLCRYLTNPRVSATAGYFWALHCSFPAKQRES
jgi:hypothetical protein